MVNMEMIHAKTLQGLSLNNVDHWWVVELMVHLERICEDIASSTSDNVDPGGSIDSQLG